MWSFIRDHPRSRGVYRSRRPPRARAWGSSPLARGLQTMLSKAYPAPRIIPARAGFTSWPPWSTHCPRDHPRSRGVYLRFPSERARLEGSSPLARGLPSVAPAGVDDLGIIPARAGFTEGPPRPGGGAADHPRSRGVYARPGRTSTESPGSSPLARGLLPHARHGIGPSGIIPARAGFTPAPPGRGRRRRDHPRSRGVYTGGSLESQRTRTLPDPCCLHCRPRARSAELR